MLPTLDRQTRLLVIAPHPDDETIGAGGLLQQVREAGGEVRIWLLTDGDNNPWPQRWLERRIWIGQAARERWGRRRRAEVVQAMSALGLAPEQLEGFSWPDMGLTGLLRGQFAAMLTLFEARLRAWCPNVVVLPDLGDRHPDHGTAHVLTRLALAREALSPTLLTYLVHGGAAAQQAEVLPSSDAYQAAKRQAMEAHASQLALSGTRMRRLIERPETFTCLEAARSGPLLSRQLPWSPPVWLQPGLRLTLAGSVGVRRWSWRRAPLVRDREGRWALIAEATPDTGPYFVKLHMDLPSPWIFDTWGWHEIS
ncbi:MAG TPA: PIG-L family deacetylase [Dyella sp.]|uniref:PIG-L deacetylase family protein n=1 Tax=Dyella sp. TaxID=1869338 RepID=UPI002F951221